MHFILYNITVTLKNVGLSNIVIELNYLGLVIDVTTHNEWTVMLY